MITNTCCTSKTVHAKNTITKRLLFCISLLTSLSVNAQLTQTIRGTVTDLVLQQPVAGASVIIAGTQSGTITDAAGNFTMHNVQVGTINLLVTCLGYKENVLPDITVNAGKEVVLSVALQQSIHNNKEVVVTTGSKNNKPLNTMNAVSSRAFTVEETQKYAAAINDPLRMATNFAGVNSANDGNNQIVIRGNSPTGLLWRMEGIDIPNPNHFAAAGSSGGGISILSAQLLSNSDFITGAWAAEYGNALSGVFDVKLRKGNNEKKEVSLGAGFLGLNASLEGPFNNNYKGSYLVNYRYSTLSLLNKIGVNTGSANATNFQDFSYNISLPAKKSGTFTLFGFAGLSSQDYKAINDSLKWQSEDDRYTSTYISNTIFTGATHNINIGNRGKLTSAIGYAYTKLAYTANYLEKQDSAALNYKDNNTTRRLTLNTTYNFRINNQQAVRAGLIVNNIDFHYYQLSKDNDNNNAPLKEKINTNGNTALVQAFAEWQYRFADNITFNTGIHYMQLFYNQSKSMEPRFSVKWDVDNKNTLAFGYGLHSQLQPLGVYFTQLMDDNKIITPNKDLRFTKAQHFVLSYDHALNHNFHIKTEIYYQQLYRVPVSVSDTNTISTLNMEDGYITDALINKGSGKNKGIEVSLEKYLNNHFYFLFSNSLYSSKYKAADGIERNTRYNGNYISNLVAGKEFVQAEGRRTVGINIKIAYAGGYRTTPVDEEQSQLLGYTVYKQKEAYSLQNPAYERADLRLSMKWNKKNFTSTLSLDIQNLTGRKNIYSQYYDAVKNKVINSYGTGFVPVLNYIAEF